MNINISRILKKIYRISNRQNYDINDTFKHYCYSFIPFSNGWHILFYMVESFKSSTTKCNVLQEAMLVWRIIVNLDTVTNVIPSQWEGLQDVIQEDGEDNHQNGTKQWVTPGFLLDDCITAASSLYIFFFSFSLYILSLYSLCEEICNMLSHIFNMWRIFIC